MKKFTFLLTLLLSSIGVNAQDVFQASNAPSETTWAENTTWYKMTLKNGYVVKYDVDKKTICTQDCQKPMVKTHGGAL